MKKIVLLFCALACLIACHDDDNEEKDWTVPSKASRTVMIYMSGENNLTYYNGFRYLSADLNEIIEGSKKLADNERLVIFVDSLNTNTKQAGKPFIMEVHGGKTFNRHEFDSDFYACDPARFREILQWMTTNAQADSYGLVLWGHACGWAVSTDTIAGARKYDTRAYGQDNGSDGNSNGVRWMNITQMAKVLQEFPKMEFIFADCCNMMCAEVGYELRNTTKYLIGSPAEIPGRGAPYHLLIPYFYKNGAELYRGIIDNYYDYYLEDYENDYQLDGYSVPLSVMDTQNQNMEELARATYDVLGTFFPEKPQMLDFKGLVFYWYPDVSVMYDMKAFIKQNASPEAYAKWETAFKRAVPYYRMSMEWMTIYAELEYAFNYFNQDESMNGCVSMFIPKENAYYNYYGIWRYNYTAKNLSWNRELGWERFGW